MAKKKETKREIHTGGGSYFEGKLQVDGDFVHGNKVFQAGNHSVVAETIKDSQIVMSGQAQSSGSAQDLVLLLQAVRDLLPQAGLPQDEMQVVTADIEVVQEQLKLPEPKKHLVLPKLESIVTVIKSAATVAEVLPKLQPMLEQMMVWARGLLGG